jgi:hypothetical protein
LWISVHESCLYRKVEEVVNPAIIAILFLIGIRFRY